MGIMVGFDGAKVASNGNCGFFIISDESKLGTINVPVGGIVKLQDSGKMLERTASGWKDYEMGGGSSGGGGNTFEKLHGYYDIAASAWVLTDEEKALNAQLYTKIVSAIENDSPISVWGKMTESSVTYNLTSVATGTAESVVIIVFWLDVGLSFTLSSDGSVTIGV